MASFAEEVDTLIACVENRSSYFEARHELEIAAVQVEPTNWIEGIGDVADVNVYLTEGMALRANCVVFPWKAEEGVNFNVVSTSPEAYVRNICELVGTLPPVGSKQGTPLITSNELLAVALLLTGAGVLDWIYSIAKCSGFKRHERDLSRVARGLHLPPHSIKIQLASHSQDLLDLNAYTGWL